MATETRPFSLWHGTMKWRRRWLLWIATGIVPSMSGFGVSLARGEQVQMVVWRVLARGELSLSRAHASTCGVLGRCFESDVSGRSPGTPLRGLGPQPISGQPTGDRRVRLLAVFAGIRHMLFAGVVAYPTNRLGPIPVFSPRLLMRMHFAFLTRSFANSLSSSLADCKCLQGSARFRRSPPRIERAGIRADHCLACRAVRAVRAGPS